VKIDPPLEHSRRAAFAQTPMSEGSERIPLTRILEVMEFQMVPAGGVLVSLAAGFPSAEGGVFI
jgi:hypothetical protein